MAERSYPELRQELAKTQRDFLESELSLAAMLADFAKTQYRQGNIPDGARSKSDAQNALKTIRHVAATTNLLGATEIDSFMRRCDELEQMFLTIRRPSEVTSERRSGRDNDLFKS